MNQVTIFLKPSKVLIKKLKDLGRARVPGPESSSWGYKFQTGERDGDADKAKTGHSFKVSSSLLKRSGDNFVLSLMSEAGRETLKQGGKEGASFILTLPAFRSPSEAQRQALS